MLNGNMTSNETKWYMKYRKCFCAKNTTIQLGYKLYLFIGAMLYIFSPIIICLAIFVEGDILTRLALVVIFVFAGFIDPIITYKTTRKEMIDNGHSSTCAHKISLLETFYSNIYNQFDPDVNVRIKNNH